MNIGTIGALLSAITSILAIMAYLQQEIKNNQARLKAEKGRVSCLAKNSEFQGKRIEALEDYALRNENENSCFQVNNLLIELEEEVMEEYRKHNTDLT